MTTPPPTALLTGRPAALVLAAVLTASFMELLDATIVSGDAEPAAWLPAAPMLLGGKQTR